jgi:hypothetical protein
MSSYGYTSQCSNFVTKNSALKISYRKISMDVSAFIFGDFLHIFFDMIRYIYSKDFCAKFALIHQLSKKN